MKKTLALLALSCMSVFASAQTVTLVPQYCSTTTISCSNIANDTMAAIPSLVASSLNGGWIHLYMPDGSYYVGVGQPGLGVTNYPVYRQPNNDAVILVTASFNEVIKKGSGSGRGGSQSHYFWYLTSGSLFIN